MNRRVLYLPIETKARELHGKILLASRAAERGWQVFLGPEREMRESLPHRPRGVYVEISIPAQKAKEVAACKALGLSVANLCEEAIVYFDGWDYCERKVDSAVLDDIDIMLVTGARNERHLRQYRPRGADKIALTGNPRFDTLMPKLREVYRSEADAIGERFGRFLLVNTNFGLVNHFKHSPEAVLGRLVKRHAADDPKHADMLKRWVSYKGDHMRKFKPVLAEIAASGSFERIVVRPHPSENLESWRKWAAPHKIDVHFEGSANSWMLAAEAVLHTGCTTGIEGVLLDRPVASFVPDPEHEMVNQADEVSVHIASAGEFLDKAAAWRGREAYQLSSEQRTKLNSFVENVSPPLSVDRILDALDKLDLPEVQLAQESGENPLKLVSRQIGVTVRALRHSYRHQKYPGLKRAEILAAIDTWMATGILKQAPKLTSARYRTWLFS